MSRPRAFVAGSGAVTCVGRGVSALRDALLEPPQDRFAPPSLVPISEPKLAMPVGEVARGGLGMPVASAGGSASLPRSHWLALAAAREAAGDSIPDAIVVGTTTGGIAATEEALAKASCDPSDYRFHGLDTIAAHLADALGSKGLAITVSTACSSGAVAVALGRQLLRHGLATRVLAGGADAICRLTYHGFRELQLLSPRPARPLDTGRSGLTLGEGAAFLLLEAEPSVGARTEIVGSGLSCDAYHATKPHPQASGAVRAMRDALVDAELRPNEVDYVNLHGTGTLDNDAAEAVGIRTVFGEAPPRLSSTKGLTGHTLAAAGAIEAVVSVLAASEGIVPANFGLEQADPALGVTPLPLTLTSPVRVVLSNSFGFGGNNACLIVRSDSDEHRSLGSANRGEHGPLRSVNPGEPRALGSASRSTTTGAPAPSVGGVAGAGALPSFRVLSVAAATAAGDLDATWEHFASSRQVFGLAQASAFEEHVPLALRRRMQRMTRILVGLGAQAHAMSRLGVAPDLICTGTAWGSLADTHDYLTKLLASGERFGSPMQFVGSVHNAAAGQLAMALGAQGPNVTCSSGHRSFEQALLCASLLVRAPGQTVLLVGADAWHDALSPLLDPAAAAGGPSDGGAAISAIWDNEPGGVRLRFLAEQSGVGEGESEAKGEPGGLRGGEHAVERLFARLGGAEHIVRSYGAVLIGASAREHDLSQVQLERTRGLLGGRLPVRLYRAELGEQASASAIACALAVRMVEAARAPAVLLLSLGRFVSAMEVRGS